MNRFEQELADGFAELNREAGRPFLLGAQGFTGTFVDSELVRGEFDILGARNSVRIEVPKTEFDADFPKIGDCIIEEDSGSRYRVTEVEGLNEPTAPSIVLVVLAETKAA